MGKFRDLTGQHFNFLTVVERVENQNNQPRWKCRCICGRYTIVSASNLKSNSIKSCGCMHNQLISEKNTLDIVGKIYGKLTVLYKVENTTKSRGARWFCSCTCGESTIASGSNLRSGAVLSCGCTRLEKNHLRFLSHGLSKTKEYKRAKTRKRNELKALHDSESTTELELTLEEFFPACVICGSMDHLEKDHVLPLSKGYGLKPGNAVVLCRSHNRSKLARSLDKLPKDWQDKILQAAKDFEKYWLSIHEEILTTRNSCYIIEGVCYAWAVDTTIS